MADLPQKFSICAKFQKLRSPGPISRTASIAAREDEDVSLGIHGHARSFAQIYIGWQLQKIRNRAEPQFRHGRLLGKKRTSQREQQGNDEGSHYESTSLHRPHDTRYWLSRATKPQMSSRSVSASGARRCAISVQAAAHLL